MTRKNLVRSVLLAAAVLAATAVAVAPARAGAKKIRSEYQALLDQGDKLWDEYSSADKAFHEKGKTDVNTHLKKLWSIQTRLDELHHKWMGMEAPDGGDVADFQVGLAIELQLSAINAEIVGLLNDDQSYLDLSSTLDKKYAKLFE